MRALQLVENNTTYERLIPVHRVTKPNKKSIIPSFTRMVSFLQKYMRLCKNCDYYLVIE
jgi:hypothetical protein